jgi:hypothetical protein
MAPRERRLVTALVGSVIAFAVLVTGFIVFGNISDIKQSNEDAAQRWPTSPSTATSTWRPASGCGRRRCASARGPQFAADLEEAAREVSIQIPETNEQPAVPVGKRYLEHKVDVKLRQVDLPSLSKFLAHLENGRR